jgi:hypothetical protein
MCGQSDPSRAGGSWNEHYPNRWDVGDGGKLHLAVCTWCRFIDCANDDRLLEMWLGIICTCLPILYTFFRTHVTAKRTSVRQGALVVVRDPNSGQVIAQAQDDSGYCTGNSTVIGMDQLDVERSGQRPSHEHSIRPAASNKSLLVTTERCND